MINKGFYPTTAALGRTMLEPYRDRIYKGGLSILEPQAGKGDLVLQIKNIESSYAKQRNKLYYFEIEPELCDILNAIPDARMLGNDFLAYKGSVFFDLIVMNPPFENGDAHLLHAWNILHSGDIVCLLNKETIDNPYTDSRQQLAELLKREGADIQYMGRPFARAERPTNVEVVMVRLVKKAQSNFFQFDKMGFASGETFRHKFTEQNPLAVAHKDEIMNMELGYGGVADGLADFVRAIQKIAYFGGYIGYEPRKLLNAASEVISMYDKQDNPYKLYNELLDKVTDCAWQEVINKTNIFRRLTSGAIKEFEKFRSTQCQMDFSADNIYKLLDFIQDNKEGIVRSCVAEIFDKLTKYSPKNQLQGWKTNSHYMINRTFIMPDVGRWDAKWNKLCTMFNREFSNWADDLDLACCHLTGKRPEELKRDNPKDKYRPIPTSLKGVVDILIQEPNFNKITIESEFFSIKVYKVGTIHCTFLDESLWQRFNQVAAEGRFEIPDEVKQPKTRKKDV